MKVFYPKGNAVSFLSINRSLGYSSRFKNALRFLLALAFLQLAIGVTPTLATTYYSGAAAVNFTDVNSWWTGATGTGSHPASITNADDYIIQNNAAIVLNGNAAVRTLTINAGSLSVSANTLTVSLATGNTAFLKATNGSTLTVSGGSVVVNGYVSIASGSTFTQSGGTITVDGNNGGVAATSVPTGTSVFDISSSTVTLSGGTIIIVDPHVGTAAGDYAFDFNGGANITASTSHTLQFGNGSSSDNTTNAGGFILEPYVGSYRLMLGNVIVNTGGTGNRFITSRYTTQYIQILGDMTITSGEYRTSGYLCVAGNITNSGTLTVSTTLYLCSGSGTSTLAATSNAQTISGAGTFRNLTSSPTANFANLTINNSSASGVTFSGANSMLSGAVTGTVNSTLNFIAGTVFTGGNPFILGTGTGTLGTLSYTAGGFGNGSQFGRWYAAATAGTTVTASTIPSSTGSGTYPFITSGGSKSFYLQRPATTGATGGTIRVTYTDGAGLNAITTVTDGAYNIDRQSAAKWTVSTGNGFAVGTGTFNYAISGAGLYAPLTANTRIMKVSSVTGNYQAGTNLPHGQRTAISAANYTGDFYLGINSGEVAVSSAQSGAWDSPSTWSGGAVPTACQAVSILAGHSVTVSSAAAVCGSLTVNGSLAVSANSLTVGCSNNNNSFITTGTLTVSGGTVNINGYLSCTSTSTFTQSGGTINVDGNAAGVAGNSVATGTPLVNLATSNLTLSGGTFVVVDPHVGTAAGDYAFSFNGGTANVSASTSHTLQFGNGTSSDNTTSANGFILEPYVGSYRLMLGNVVVNTGGTGNRFITNRYTTQYVQILGDLTITSGEYRTTGYLCVAGNISNAGTLSATNNLYLSSGSGTGTLVASTNAQTISGTGTFRNLTSSPTANFSTLTINNTSASGVTFSGANSMLSGAVTGTVSGTLTFTAGTVYTGGNPFILGTGTAATGTITLTAGSGFGPGSMYGRWYAAGSGGATITASTVPNSTGTLSIGTYPFISGTNSRFFYIQRPTTTGATGGVVRVLFTDGTGLGSISTVADGAYNIDMQSLSKWTVSTSNGFAAGTGTFTYAIAGQGIFSPANTNTRLMATSTVPGTHQVGTTLPLVERTGLAAANFTGDFFLGVSSGDVPVTSAQTGPWESASTWVGGAVPGACSPVIIASGHNVTVGGAASNNCGSVTISSGGTLTVSANTLTVGCSNNNSTLLNNGTMSVSGGAVNINGNLSSPSGSTFSQTGGTISVDGNATGVAGNSVLTGTALVSLATSNITLSGGTFIVVDPHVGTATTDYAFYFSKSTDYNATGWTLQFGDGTSTDGTTNTNGFIFNHFASTGKLLPDNMIVSGGSGTNRFVSWYYTGSEAAVLKDVTINSGGELRSPASGGFHVGGNITVNSGGTFTNTSILYLENYASSTSTATTLAQTISGAGTFRNLTSSPTANFTSLKINNSNASGVTFSGANSMLSGAVTGTVSGTLTFTAGTVSTGGNPFILGIGTGTLGTLSYASGGFADGSIFGRWYAAATSGTTITASTIPSSTGTGTYPFVSGSNSRFFYLQRPSTTGATGGVIKVAFADGVGMNTISIITDGAYNIDEQSNATWTVSTANGFAPGTGTFTYGISGQGLFATSTTNTRVMNASGLVGSHQAGTTLPHGQRTGLAAANFANTFYLGFSSSDVLVQSAQSGPWESGSTWVGGNVPAACNPVQILNGHNVTVNSAAANCGSLTINSGGTLTASGNTLTVGCSGNNSALSSSGTLTVSGGTINVNGNVALLAGSTFNQSAGNINVDPNSGIAGTSTGNTTVTFSIATANLNVTGGTITIIDPPFNASSARSFEYNISTTPATFGSAHTLKFGDGVSTDASSNANGFSFDTYVGSGRLLLGNVTVNGGSATNRWVTTSSTSGNGSDMGSLTINSGSELRDISGGAAVRVAGDIVNNGTLTVVGTLSLNSLSGNTVAASPNTQTISGGGTFRNSTGSSTASVASLTVNNSNATGVTLSVPFSVSGTLTLTAGYVNTDATNLLALNSGGTLSGGSATAYIKGPFQRTFPASSTGSTTYLFPVGKSAYNPISVKPTTTSGGTVSMRGEAFDANSGTAGTGIAGLSSKRWEALITSGSANFTSANLVIGDASILSSNTIAQAPSAAGVYDVLSGTFTYAAGSPNTLTTGTAITAANWKGYFAYGSSPLALGTVTVTQQTGTVQPGTSATPILLITLPTTGNLGTLTLNSVNVTYTGTTGSDIAASGVKLWTGTSSAPTAQIGSSLSLSGGMANFTGLTTSLTGTTYLWVTLDIASGATMQDLVDAKIVLGDMSITATGGATATGTQPVADLDPVGSKTIEYCQGTFTHACSSNDIITAFSISTLSAAPGCPGGGSSLPNNYSFNSATTSLTKGNSYTANFTIGTGGSQGVGIWIDYNHNGSFLDAGEFVGTSTTVGASSSGSLTVNVPAGASSGTTRMRVVNYFSANPTQASVCSTGVSYGTTTDFNITIAAPTNNDAGVSNASLSASCPGPATVTATIKNFGTLTLTSAVINWQINSGTINSQSVTGISVAAGGTTTTTFSITVPSGLGNTLKVYTTLPNGVTDENSANDNYIYTLSGGLSGTYTVGTSGDFATLTAAVAAANSRGLCGPTIFSLINNNYGDAIETYPLQINALTGSSAVNTLTIQPATIATLGTSTSSPLIYLNGASNIIINGGTGTSHNLNMYNNYGGASDIVIDGGCTNVTINNCDLSTYGDSYYYEYSDNIEFTNINSYAAVSASIINCNIHGYGGYQTYVGVYCDNNAAVVTLTGNNIYDFENIGIDAYDPGNGWIIANNNLYNTITSYEYQSGIYVDGGSGHSITGNNIGGSSANCGGAAWKNGNDGYWSTGIFDGIYFNGVSGTNTVIQNNTVSNITFTDDYGDDIEMHGIWVDGSGSATVGTTASPNIVQNINGTGTSENHYFCGIGVVASGTGNSIAGNIIRNCTMSGGGTYAFTHSIYYVGGDNCNISYNQIYNITSASNNYYDITNGTGSSIDDAVDGIYFSEGTNSTIANNTIYNLTASYTGSEYTVAGGIVLDNFYYTTSGNVYGNLIYGLTNKAVYTSTFPGLYGIRVGVGTWNVYNNQIILTNGNNSNAVRIYGLDDLTAGSTNYLYNSVYIGGLPATSSAPSAAFTVERPTNSITLKNNLLYNERKDTLAATGKNYAIFLHFATAPTTFASDYNDLYSSGTSANYIGVKSSGGTAQSTLAGWQSASPAGDANSQNKKVLFKQSNPPTTSMAPDATTNCWLNGKATPITTGTYPPAATGLTSDFTTTYSSSGVTRSATTPDIGAIEFTMNAQTLLTLIRGTDSSNLSLSVCIGDTVKALATTAAPVRITYAWTTPDAYAVGNDSTFTRAVTAPMAGSYIVNVTDSLSCISADTVALVINPLSVFTATATNVSCHDANDGKITISTTAGSSPFSYSLNGGTTYPYSASPITGLSGATYNVQIKDNNGCVAASAQSVTINNPATLVVAPSNDGPYAVSSTINLSSNLSGGTGPFTYSWTGPSFANSGANPSILDAVLANAGTYNLSVTDANGCGATGSTNVVVVNAFTWVGINGQDWAVNTNWSPVAPIGGPNSCAANVYIPYVVVQPIINSAVQVGNVQIEGSAQITVNNTMSVCQDWIGGTGTNAQILGSGKLIFNGSSAQAVTGKTAVGEIEINNTSTGVTLQAGSTLDVFNALDLHKGNFAINAGALATFKSTTVTQAAIIDNFSAGYTGTLTGNITAERFYDLSQTFNQHFMGSPINSPALSQFGISGTGGYVIPLTTCDETQMIHTSPYGTVFSYHESHGATCGMAQWYVETGGNAQNGVGYSILKYGSGTIALSGAPNLNASYTVGGLTNSAWSNQSYQHRNMSSGWQLLSNPYLATLQMTTPSAGFDNQVQVWNTSGPYAGTYQPYVIGSGTPPVVAPFQAFMVHKTAAGGTATYNISGSDRVRASHQFFAVSDNKLELSVTNNANGMMDKTIVAFDQNATDQFDVNVDADKFGGALNRHTLYSVNNGKWMAINVLNSIASTSTVPVGLEPGKTGSYTFSFSGVSTFDPTVYIMLEDLQTGVMHNVRNGDYAFTSDSADNWNRFVLHFTPAAEFNAVDATCNAPGVISINQPGTANWNYVITNSSNQQISSGVLNAGSPVSVIAPAGAYTVTLTDNAGYTVVKPLVVTGAVGVTAGFVAPVTAPALSQVTFTNTTDNGSSYTWTISDGTVINGVTDATYTFTAPGVYTVTLNASNVSGCSSSITQTITITEVATGISNVVTTKGISLWSSENRVYVDFGKTTDVNAVISIYNVLGQEISVEKHTNNNVYVKELDELEAAYVIVSVKNNDAVTTKKLFIVNKK